MSISRILSFRYTERMATIAITKSHLSIYFLIMRTTIYTGYFNRSPQISLEQCILGKIFQIKVLGL